MNRDELSLRAFELAKEIHQYNIDMENSWSNNQYYTRLDSFNQGKINQFPSYPTPNKMNFDAIIADASKIANFIGG